MRRRSFVAASMVLAGGRSVLVFSFMETTSARSPSPSNVDLARSPFQNRPVSCLTRRSFSRSAYISQ